MDNYVRVLEALGQGLGHPVRSVHQGPQEQVSQEDSCHACADLHKETYVHKAWGNGLQLL